VTANALSPGVVSTGIMRHFGCAARALFALVRPFIKVSGAGPPRTPSPRVGGARPSPLLTLPPQSAEQGAASTIYCAVSEEVAGITGKYFESDCGLALPSAAARDAGLARQLWEESERLTGLTHCPPR